jgi:hypothetical protein
MGRTIPSFRLATLIEKDDWNEFRNRLCKSDRKLFDRMFSISHLYNSACSYAAVPIRIQPILMSIIFHHYVILKGLEADMQTNQTNGQAQNKTKMILSHPAKENG